ncbi:MAG: lysylphosphatidylglycerol synthase transmembrane domain-containing protein [Deltaproteobacteria bacterium]
MSRPTWARWVTRISLVIAVVALVWTIRDTGLATIGRYFKRIGWWWFAVIALEVVITSLDAVAIRAFMSPEQDRVRLRSALLSQLAGRSVNAVTPSGQLGEAVKVSVLTEHVSQSRAVATILLYNVVSFTVELAMVAVAAPFVALLVPMPSSLRWVMLGAGVLCAVLAIGLYMLVHKGVMASLARVARKIYVPGLAALRRRIWKQQNPSHYLLSAETAEALHDSLTAVDDKMRVSEGARARDRISGIAAVTMSRLTSMTLSLLILHAVGESITVGFVAAYTVGGFAIYMLSTLVPMGLGISEGGNYWLFRALGENPARGVTLVVARRVTVVLYAAIGLVLVAASETVARAREGIPSPEPLPAGLQAPGTAALPSARVIDAAD